MAAPLTFLHLQRCCRRLSVTLVARLQSSSAPVAPPPLHTRILHYLSERFYDIEGIVSWTSWLSKRGIRRKNVLFHYAQKNFGNNIAAAYYILSLKGGFRYAGETDWFRCDKRGKFSYDFMNQKDSVIEEVDVSNTVINYNGLENLVGQRSLRTLSLRGCPEVDDWFLTRLHVFQDTLEELDISLCPRVTVRGLPVLHNLRKLRRLNVSSLPLLQNPGLAIILLEDMLPDCRIQAAGYHLHTEAREEEGEEDGAGTEPMKAGRK